MTAPARHQDVYRVEGRDARGITARRHDLDRAIHRSLTDAEAKAMLAALRSELIEPRTVAELKPGLEDFRAVMSRLDAAAKVGKGGVVLETIGKVHGLPVKVVKLLGGPSPDGKPKPKLLILGGVHSGTEKTGFEAATRFVEKAAADSTLRAKFDITVIPLVNPTALVLGTRENAKGVDINRTFTPAKYQPESKVLAEWLKGRAFDASLDLHTAGDPGRDGFFLIRGTKDGGLGARMMQALPKAALLDAKGKPGEARVGPYILYGVGLSEIESIKHTTMDLLREQGTRYVYTFEAPTRADPRVQVELTERFVMSALNNIRAHGKLGPVRELRAPVREVREASAKALDRFRRADGTLDWKRLGRAKALPEVAGLAHFGLALFLKEIAVVAATGDRLRIEEFFDGLMTTDFYKQYGLFVAGARLGELAYAKSLERYVKPRFVNGLLKTNLVLAAGLALPMIVEGKFSGRSFAISLGALGLSVSAVRGGVAGIKWVSSLRKARQVGLLTKVGTAGRLAKLGGWFYTAAELAVVLYVAEKIETEVNERLALAEARETLSEAAGELIDAVNDPRATVASVSSAVTRHRDAWGEFRNFLYTPLFQDEALLAIRTQKLARKAQLLAAKRKAAEERVAKFPGLRENVSRRYGSVAKWAAAKAREDEAALQRDVDSALDTYAKDREKHLAEVYRGKRRKDALLADVDTLPWLLAGAVPGAAGDPFGARTDPFARWGRHSTRAAFDDAIEGASTNRLQAYDDERAVLDAIAASLAARGRSSLARVVRAAADRARVTQATDAALVTDPRRGLSDKVDAR